MAASWAQPKCQMIKDDISDVCHLWRLPIEILDMIFELSFVQDRSLDDLKYANRRKQHLNTPLDRLPRRMQKVRRLPTQLAVSRDWYTLALRSWLRIGTLIVSATTIHNLRESCAKLRSQIISVKLRIDRDGLDNYARTQHRWTQMDTHVARRWMARKFTKEVLDLCPNLQRLKLTRMNFKDFLALETLYSYSRRYVDLPIWGPVVFDELWANLFVGHENLQHLALFTRSFRGRSGDMMEDDQTLLAVKYFNVRLKCRGIPSDDYEAMAKAIGYHEEAGYIYTGYVGYEASSKLLDSLHICKLMYKSGHPGWRFFDAAWDRIYRNGFG